MGHFERIFRKPEACCQTVLPDRSILIGQKLAGNAKIDKSKCDILGHFSNNVTCIIYNHYNVVLHSRFRHYYQHILTFRWLHPRQPDAPTGLILASTFGLQVAAHLALDHNNHQTSQIEDMEDVVVVNAKATDSTLEKIERNPSRTTTQTSSVTSSIISRRKILTLSGNPDPDIIITSQLEEAEPLTPVSEPVKDNLVMPALSPILSQQSEVRNSIFSICIFRRLLLSSFLSKIMSHLL